MHLTAELFKSLADMTRLRLLLLLRDGTERCVCDLMHALDMPQSTVSRHLAHLKRNGWLQDRRGGVWMHYSLHRQLAPLLRGQLTLLIDHLADSPTCLQDRERLDVYLQNKVTTACE
jgi:ArsR family transcriptional regulator